MTEKNLSDKMQTVVDELPFSAHLSEEEKQNVKESVHFDRYPAGAMLNSCGTECLGMIRVLSGGLRVSILSEEGRQITLYRLRAGDCCVLSASCVISQINFETQIEAEEDTEVMIVPSCAFGKLTETNIHVRCFMYELISERFSTVMWVFQQILFARFDRRLAIFLVRTVEETNSTVIRMTQEQIASEVNSAREVVTRMLRLFASDGLIEIGRGVVTVKNLEGLKKIM